MPKLVTKPFKFPIGGLERSNQRFDVILRGVSHIGCSYEGRVFLNNVKATEKTATTSRNGYAKSFYIFGHGDCYGAPGHCDPLTERLPYDDTPASASLPLEIHVNITAALKRASKNSKNSEFTLTIVPIPDTSTPNLKVDSKKVMIIDGPISIVAYA